MLNPNRSRILIIGVDRPTIFYSAHVINCVLMMMMIIKAIVNPSYYNNQYYNCNNIKTNMCVFTVRLILFSCYQVTAFDKDPPENGGTINNYTFVAPPGERPKFSIDRLTGVITTRYVSIFYFLITTRGSFLLLLYGKFNVNTVLCFCRCSIGTSLPVKKKCTSRSGPRTTGNRPWTTCAPSR